MNGIIHWLNTQKSANRSIFCLVIALFVFAMVTINKLAILTGIMLSWDTFCLLLLALSWITFNSVQQSELSLKAQEADESRSMTFVLVLLSVSSSLVGIILLMNNTDSSLVSKNIHRTVSLLGVALSWGLLHTIFTLRYAHLYYSGNATDEKPAVGGLEFPNDDKPDYLDFAYFSFVVGMTFQVSDVAITSKLIRRVALLHGFIAFVFNTAIVAFTISIVSNLGSVGSP